MRADAIAKVIAKLNAAQEAALKALEGQPSEVGPDLPALPEEAAGDMPGRPDIVPPTQPEEPDLPDEALAAGSGRPVPVPASRPTLPEAATDFCPETGLPMVAMADDHVEEEEAEEIEFL